MRRACGLAVEHVADLVLAADRARLVLLCPAPALQASLVPRLALVVVGPVLAADALALAAAGSRAVAAWRAHR